MIQLQELRIGNYIFYKNEIFEVDAISKSHTYLLKGKNIVKTTTECLNPIPLTEEILLKFGFEIEKTNTHIIAYNDYGYQHELEINKEYKHKSWRIEQYKGGYRHLYFCHQLQNLYFALTGEELQLK